MSGVPAETRVAIDAEIVKNYPDLDALYRDPHQRPELGFQATWTAAQLAGRMRKIAT